MGLDLVALGKQVRKMSLAVAKAIPQRNERIATVRRRYLDEQGQEDHWIEAVRLSAKTANWLLAVPVEPLGTVKALPPIPSDYAIAATDGSHIDVDRHGDVLCYLINIGQVYIRYGAQAEAQLTSVPMLYYEEEDLFLEDGTRRIPIEGAVLSVRRDVAEGIALQQLAEKYLEPLDLPRLALQDGTLMRWALANVDAKVRDTFLQPYLQYLERMRQARIPVASYISRSRSPEVMGLVRLMFCPDVNVAQQIGANCAQCSDVKHGRTPSCMICQDLIDADIFAPQLAEGQRSPVFRSLSRISVVGYEHHQIHFFFMRIGRELVRIEIPAWVAEQPAWLDQVHALVYDQAARGQGYPVALQRAHEQAVIRNAERRAFEQIVAGALRRAGAPAGVSAKRESKQFVQE